MLCTELARKVRRRVRAGRLSLSLSGSYSEGRKWVNIEGTRDATDDTRVLLSVVRGCVQGVVSETGVWRKAHYVYAGL